MEVDRAKWRRAEEEACREQGKAMMGWALVIRSNGVADSKQVVHN
jgi:hypothetical protein